MNITTEVTGVTDIVGFIQDLPERIRAEGMHRMENVVFDVTDHVLNEKLSGQVLNRVSGKLAGGVYGEVHDLNPQIVGEIGVDGVPYARIQEEGGTTPAHEIIPSAAKALSFMWLDGERWFFAKVNHPGSVMPARSYLRSSLMDLKDQIIEELQQGVVDAVRK